MNRVRRLRERVVNTKNNCSFEDLSALLQALGFSVRQPRRGGSHYTFKHTIYTITVPYARPVKRCYVREVLEIVAPLIASSQENGDSEGHQ
ncbi:MAG: type II toxin-antitoxin system HicA family toxin [Candidatus Eremiobacteraeota bacterium]|nr:type II toxin-antitoxin system HicA family toxin [Candidatus Eremiobacteraeota bacterium]